MKEAFILTCMVIVMALMFPPSPVWIIEKVWYWCNVKRKQNL